MSTSEPAPYDLEVDEETVADLAATDDVTGGRPDAGGNTSGAAVRAC